MVGLLDRRLNVATLYYGFMHVALLVLAIEVFVLAKQNRELKKLTEPPDPVKIGNVFVLGPLQPMTLGAGIDTTSPMLIYVFSTKCGVCRKNVANWASIAHAQDSKKLQVLGISIDSASSTLMFVKEEEIHFPVFTLSDGRTFRTSNQINFVPQTILRDGKGRVDRVWAGLISDSLKSDIFQILSSRNHY